MAYQCKLFRLIPREVVVPRKVKHEEKAVKYLNDLELKKFLNYMDQLDKTKYKISLITLCIMYYLLLVAELVRF